MYLSICEKKWLWVFWTPKSFASFKTDLREHMRGAARPVNTWCTNVSDGISCSVLVRSIRSAWYSVIGRCTRVIILLRTRTVLTRVVLLSMHDTQQHVVLAREWKINENTTGGDGPYYHYRDSASPGAQKKEHDIIVYHRMHTCSS